MCLVSICYKYIFSLLHISTTLRGLADAHKKQAQSGTIQRSRWQLVFMLVVLSFILFTICPTASDSQMKNISKIVQWMDQRYAILKKNKRTKICINTGSSIDVHCCAAKNFIIEFHIFNSPLDMRYQKLVITTKKLLPLM